MWVDMLCASFASDFGD